MGAASMKHTVRHCCSGCHKKQLGKMQTGVENGRAVAFRVCRNCYHKQYFPLMDTVKTAYQKDMVKALENLYAAEDALEAAKDRLWEVTQKKGK